ncbi:MAG: exodeoxyribonuclease VII large subunit [Candidatus Omnitrophica bacterium]|nr:exodeoxyribonuclease VII large subunit [Candidatus Omnitrophota bacterium]
MPKVAPDLFSQIKGPERHIYKVREITKDIKLILENSFGEVWVEGEVSNFKSAASGHFYFSLKDESAVLAAAMFSRANKEVKFKIEDGLKMVCFGRIDVYPPRGNYQLIVEKIEPKGIGARQLAFEQLKKKLFKEGLFEQAHKKPLPAMPFKLGVVTSSQGAAVRDILQILRKGAPFIDLIIRPVRVQGEAASGEIAGAIEDFNKFGQVDALIISRGGGSIEDLWSFNEEIVARAIYNSKLPTISAVGHQINITLSDLVADVFVETPSAAAKIIVDRRNVLLADLDNYRHSLSSSILEVIYNLKHALAVLLGALISPLDRLLEKQQLIDEFSAGLNRQIRQILNITQEKLSYIIEKLEVLSPLSVLSRGYSLSTQLGTGEIIKDAAKLNQGDKIKTILDKGSFISTVREVIKDDKREKRAF